MLHGVAGRYMPFSGSQEGFSFRIYLEGNVSVEGKGYASQKERDVDASRVAKELGIILTSDWLSPNETEPSDNKSS